MSDSEEAFESADEQIVTTQKSKRSDNKFVKNETEIKKISTGNTKLETKSAEGWDDDEWDDFDVENPEKSIGHNTKKENVLSNEKNKSKDGWDDFDVENTENSNLKKEETLSNDKNEDNKSNDGWDDFDDWGNEDNNTKVDKTEESKAKKSLEEHSEKEYKELADRLSSMGDSNSGGNSGWGGWGGWGVTSLLSSGVSQLTSHVSQGIASVSQVIESGMGVPNPEELAQIQANSKEKLKKEKSVEGTEDHNKISSETNDSSTQMVEGEMKQDDSMGVFKIGKLVSNVTKLVESTGSAVVSGGLDTLEEIGKRTMRVLQGEDEGKKRLSTLLKEARDRIEDHRPNIDTNENVPKKNIPKFESLFDDFQGLVHLEALEMLSKQCDMKIQSLLLSYEGQELIDLRETLDQVKDICELPDTDEDDDKDDGSGPVTSDVLKNKLVTSVKDMGIQLQFDNMIKCWDEIIKDATNKDYESNEESENEEKRIQDLTEKAENVMIKAITSLAESSALSVQLLHRATALLSVRERRSTADEADGLTQLTTVLSSHIGEIAALYSQKMNDICKLCKNSEKINGFITNVFLEAGKGSSYIQDAFLLTIPILQVGAT